MEGWLYSYFSYKNQVHRQSTALSICLGITDREQNQGKTGIMSGRFEDTKKKYNIGLLNTVVIKGNEIRRIDGNTTH